jgi:uncharacterized membrane protein YkoI
MGRSDERGENQAMRFLLLAVVSLSTLSGAHFSRAAENDGGRVCYSQAETRQEIAKNKLSDPLAALRTAARSARAEPLVSRLCKWKDQWVYEMTLLPKNGKVTRVFINAADGSTMPPRD